MWNERSYVTTETDPVSKMLCLDNGQNSRHVLFEAITAVTMKNSMVWDIRPCSPMKVNRRFGGIYRLHFRVEKWNKQENSMKQAASRAYFSSLNAEEKCPSET
jgi:hypothetical protein